MCYEQIANVKSGNDVTGETQIKKEVRQDYALTPDLFNLYSEINLHGINEFEGKKVNGVNLNNIRYSNDNALISMSQWQLQKMLITSSLPKLYYELKKIGEQYGMSINVNKAECLVVTKLETVQRLTLSLKGNSIKQTAFLICWFTCLK